MTNSQGFFTDRNRISGMAALTTEVRSAKQNSYYRTRIRPGIAVMLIICVVIIGCSPEVNYAPPAGSTEIAITHYSFGKVVVNNKTYENDIVIFPDSTVKNWHSQINQAIQLIDIKDLLTKNTKTLIIGIGANKVCSVTDEIVKYAISTGVELHILDTYEAVKLFNASSKNGIAACFHANC